MKTLLLKRGTIGGLLSSLFFFMGCVELHSSVAKDAGDDTEDTDSEAVDTGGDSDTEAAMGTFGISPGGGLLESTNYTCQLTVGMPATDEMKSSNYSVVFTTGALAYSIENE